MVWPDATVSHRVDVDEAMQRVPRVLDECRDAFAEVFGRDPSGPIESWHTEDADTVLVTSATVSTTARRVVERRRAGGERVGLVKMRLFRPFPEAALREACGGARRIGVLDRDYAAGMGGVWWQDTRAAFQGDTVGRLIQNYLVGVGGGDVTPELIDGILDDLETRHVAAPPVWVEVEGALARPVTADLEVGS